MIAVLELARKRRRKTTPMLICEVLCWETQFCGCAAFGCEAACVADGAAAKLAAFKC
jgi:hypothetical protein